MIFSSRDPRKVNPEVLNPQKPVVSAMEGMIKRLNPLSTGEGV
jgi:hypothetical protein